MPLSVVLLLKPRGQPGPSGFFGRAIHGYFLRLIRELDSSLSMALHKQPNKPFTVSPLFHQASQGRGEGQYWLRLTSLSKELSLLLARLHPDGLGLLKLGAAELEVQAILKEREEHLWAGSCTYEELYNNGLLRAREVKNRLIGFKFITPTAFKIAKSAGLYMPLPWPRLVFQSLAEKWNSFSPIPLWVNWPEFERTVTVAHFHNLKSSSINFGRFSLGGFTGECWYLVGAQAGIKLHRALSTLAEFAFYAGVGWKTTMGMGMVQPIFQSRLGQNLNHFP